MLFLQRTVFTAFSMFYEFTGTSTITSTTDAIITIKINVVRRRIAVVMKINFGKVR